MNPSIIRVENLHYSYKQSKGTTEALQGLSFQVRENSITGILGPNGSGKSTAFKFSPLKLRFSRAMLGSTMSRSKLKRLQRGG